MFYDILSPYEADAKANDYVVGFAESIDYVQGLYRDDKSIMWDAAKLEQTMKSDKITSTAYTASEGDTIDSIAEKFGTTEELLKNANPDYDFGNIADGDSITLIEKGVLPPRDVLEHMMAARHSPKVHETVRRARVGIAGLGGLGSNIAAMLARTGVGQLVLADFDIVEPSNLNRQNYFVSHLGQYKTEATASLIHQINPFISVETHNVRITAENAMDLFADCDVVCEAFDNPVCKAELVSTLLSESETIRIVSGSGSCQCCRGLHGAVPTPLSPASACLAYMSAATAKLPPQTALV